MSLKFRIQIQNVYSKQIQNLNYKTSNFNISISKFNIQILKLSSKQKFKIEIQIIKSIAIKILNSFMYKPFQLQIGTCM